MSVQSYDGFNDLADELSDIIKKVENPVDVLEVGAKEFVKDLSKLTKPYSKIKKANYTHLVDSFSYAKKKDSIDVGWGKYYGLMVEKGTTLMRAQPHLEPVFERNKEKYYKMMIDEIMN